ncbi:MAG: D-lyxose/D-mannose family sugar isomerase, partial [Amnibacterium sp.]
WVRRAADLRVPLERGLGWDVTDFGRGDFDAIGLTLLTVRNGTTGEQAAGIGQTYAEKVMHVGVHQETPFHLHRRKTEDILNRGGGRLVVELVDPEDGGAPVRALVNGVPTSVAPGTLLHLAPGEGVQVPHGIRHRFWAEGAPVLAGEVSSVNDDAADNVFLVEGARYPTIDEDVPARRLLVAEYPALLGGGSASGR